MKKFLILTVLLFACVTSTIRVEARASHYRGMWFGFYPYWTQWQWGYWWVYQYPNFFQPYRMSCDTRKNLLQGKILYDDSPRKGSKKVGKKVFAGKVF